MVTANFLGSVLVNFDCKLFNLLDSEEKDVCKIHEWSNSNNKINVWWGLEPRIKIRNKRISRR